GDYTYLIEKKWDRKQGGKVDLEKCFYINNGVNIELFNQQMCQEKLQDSDLENDKFKVIYTGSIRPVNNIDQILDAAKLLKTEKDIKILIYGEGNQLNRLKKRINNENITN